jgi:hypothetical protein
MGIHSVRRCARRRSHLQNAIPNSHFQEQRVGVRYGLVLFPIGSQFRFETVSRPRYSCFRSKSPGRTATVSPRHARPRGDPFATIIRADRRLRHRRRIRPNRIVRISASTASGSCWLSPDSRWGLVRVLCFAATETALPAAGPGNLPCEDARHTTKLKTSDVRWPRILGRTMRMRSRFSQDGV